MKSLGHQGLKLRYFTLIILSYHNVGCKMKSYRQSFNLTIRESLEDGHGLPH